MDISNMEDHPLSVLSRDGEVEEIPETILGWAQVVLALYKNKELMH